MTEKRFIFHGTEIEDTLETDVDYKYTSCNKDGFQDLCELLNELHEENEQLRKKNKELKKSIGEYVRINKENELLFEINNGLGKENEQLKSKNRGLQSELQIFKEDVTHSNLQINKLFDENEQLKIQLQNTSDQRDEFGRGARENANRVGKLKKENEQLKQRNSNQYNQLNELWQLIEEENWEKLIAMKKQLKEDEERLQKEWGTYND